MESGQVQVRPFFDIRSPNAGLLDWHVTFGGLVASKNHTFLDNAGYGILFKPPKNSDEDTMDTLSFMALYGP